MHISESYNSVLISNLDVYLGIPNMVFHRFCSIILKEMSFYNILICCVLIKKQQTQIFMALVQPTEELNTRPSTSTRPSMVVGLSKLLWGNKSEVITCAKHEMCKIWAIICFLRLR